MNELFQWGQTHLKFQKISSQVKTALVYTENLGTTSLGNFANEKKIVKLKFFNEFQIFLLKLF